MLYGKELEFLQGVDVIVEDGIFHKISNTPLESDDDVYDAEGLLLIPGLINAHTHIGDSIAKDIGSDGGLEKRVHPLSGIKPLVLRETSEEHLAAYMQASALSMLKRGITTFADFREGGVGGITLLTKALAEIEIRCVALGRVDHYLAMECVQRNDALPSTVMNDAERVIELSDGFGISGANEYSDSALAYFGRTARASNKLVGIHAAETAEAYDYSLKNFGESEVSRVIRNLMPSFLVHMTRATDEELKEVSTKKIGVVVCPRANGVLGAGIPRIANMLKHRCTVAIGTDNVMLNSPDLFREMDYLWRTSRALEGNFLGAKELVKMVTVNAATVLNLKRLGYIQENALADAVFIDTHAIDIDPMHDPYAALVHRTSESSIKAVMVGGKFVHGTI
jgi:cytosine/adenosine deaminase-related metal-dependent hydrolase